MVNAAARAIMTAQEGNYLALPKGVTAEIIDVPFSAAAAILESIRYFGQLKLMVCNMQWMAMSGVSGTGSYAAMNDSSSMAVMTYNAMRDGFAAQFDAQVGKRLFQWNSFPGMTRRPRAVIPHIEKVISLNELGSILAPLAATMPLGDEDYIAIRRRTGFLPETLPEVKSEPEPEPTEDGGGEPEPGGEEGPEDGEPDGENTPAPEQREQALQLAQRQAYWQRWLLQHPEAMEK
jgi:hypothetical protein